MSSIATVEIRSFSGPDLVELDGVNRPAIIRLNVGPQGPAGPAGPNSVTSATTSDATCVLTLEALSIGQNSSVTGSAAAAIGECNATSSYDFAVGYQNTASGGASFASGSGSTSSGSVSFALGSGCVASGFSSHAVGVRAKSIHDGASVESDSQIADVESTTTDEKTFRFQNGYRFLGGSATFDGTLFANHIHGNIAGSVYAHVRAGENLAKGDPVYISGSHGTGANLIAIVSKADASNAAKMPAVGVMDAAVSANANGHMVITGTIADLNTAAYAVNDTLYVASGGGLTATPPTANSQPVARVERSNANNGALIVKVNGLASNGGNGVSDANKLVRFSSTGTIPVASIGGLGTGVATALAVNTGSAGAFVVNGGTATNMTFAGTAAFTSTTRPTSAGTGTPAATSLMTRDDVDSRVSALILDFDYSTASSGATGGSGSWSYTLPANAKALDIICVSAGSGGGSGRCGATGTNRFGGSGGASGSVTVIQSVPVSLLPSLTLSISTGLGGSGGAAQLTSDTNGNDGQIAQGAASVSSSTTIICQASTSSTQTSGKGGTSTSSPVGSYPASNFGSYTYQASNAGGVTTLNAASGSSMVPTSGTGGGGVNTSNVFSRGQTYGSANSAGGCWGGAPHGTNPANGVDGATGTDPVIVDRVPVGSGGSGGSGGAAVQGGAGRNGVRGGGGGGGGGGTNGFGSGAGGKGGDGFVRIIVRF